MDYRLVAIDIDGTLLTPELEISDATVKVIRKAIENGVVITLSTGRMYLAALSFAEMLQLDVPLITCNGALTKCSVTGKVYDTKTIPAEYCSEILQYCRANRISTSIYNNDEIFIEKGSANYEIHEYMDKSEPQVVEDLSRVLDGSIIKLLINSNEKKALEYHTNALYDKYGDKLNFYFSLPYFVEIVNISANKRNALESLAEQLDIKREEIIAIGDNYNDMDMIQYAGLGVAMGNAPQYLKEQADFVTRSNDEDGVMYVIEKFILKHACLRS